MEDYIVTYQEKQLKFPKQTTYYDIAKSLEVKDAVAVSIDNEVFPLEFAITNHSNIKFVDGTVLAGYKIVQAGLKFLFQVAVMELYKDSVVHYLHSVPKGILSEVVLDHELSTEEVSKIKEKMAFMINNKIRFKRYNVNVKDAVEYFKKIHEDEKALNVQCLPNEVVTLYQLDKYLNYYYNIMPYDTSVLNRFELVYIGKNRIVLVVPNVTSKEAIPEYVHYENIVDNFMSTKKWLRMMRVPYLSDMNRLVSKGTIKDFILSNETLYTEDLMNARDKILSMKEVRIVLIAGPSSSGKTTTMKRMSFLMRSKGYEPVGLSTDDFFMDREDTPKDGNGEYDFECLQAIDLELFNKTLQQLLKGEEVSIPEYDFVHGKKEFKGRKVLLKKNSLLIIEGLHCLNDDLLPNIEDKYKYKIYLSPFIPLNIDCHNYISTLDLRLIRRIVRDNKTRGRSVESTIDDWQNVRSGEEKYIFPYVYQADMIINTALAYEVGVLKIYANPLLYSVDISSPYYSEARRLIYYLQVFFSIPSECVPEYSVLREFIGF